MSTGFMWLIVGSFGGLTDMAMNLWVP